MLPHRDPAQHGVPFPAGTGFFVSSDGWFSTAAHVVADGSGTPRSDIDELIPQKEPADGDLGGAHVHAGRLDRFNADIDVALIKFDFGRNAQKAFLGGASGFPTSKVSSRVLDEGEPVYAFGYPLSDARVWSASLPGVQIGQASLRPRVTSAIVASRLKQTEMFRVVAAPPAVYVLDKALNYGNSGGPIVASDTDDEDVGGRGPTLLNHARERIHHVGLPRVELDPVRRGELDDLTPARTIPGGDVPIPGGYHSRDVTVRRRQPAILAAFSTASRLLHFGWIAPIHVVRSSECPRSNEPTIRSPQ